MIFTDNFTIEPSIVGSGQQSVQLSIDVQAANNRLSTPVQITYHLPNQSDVVWTQPSDGTINQNGKELILIESFTDEGQTFTSSATLDIGEGIHGVLTIGMVAVDLTDKSQETLSANLAIQ